MQSSAPIGLEQFCQGCQTTGSFQLKEGDPTKKVCECGREQLLNSTELTAMQKAAQA